ncbi:tetratricopeptide repeat protein [Pseudidiomarina sp.]|uniref:tetratricopeptide repeat protein n=1 Tax=Pseudidiomarina sp. TaxID=2081707 RepID=UPI003A97276F
MMHKKLTTLLSASVLCTVMAVASAPAASQEINYNLPSAEAVEAAKQSRRNQTVSERVGRRLMTALDLYTEEEDTKGAIAILEEIDPSSEFDTAYLNRFLGNLYAADNQVEKAFDLVKKAADADVLGFGDQALVLKLTADLALQSEEYRTALTYYGRWLQFTGEADPDVFLRIANAYYELKQFEKIVRPADLAIAAYEAEGEFNKNPYVLKVAAYYETENYREAIKVLEVGLNKLPTEKVWWSQLGMLYMLTEQIDKALQTLEISYLAGYMDKESQIKALIQLYANSQIPHKAATLMVKHLNAGDIEKTARNYQSAASSFEQAREYSQAAAMYGLSAELQETQAEKAEFYRRQGTAYLRAEEYSKAADSFLRALDLGIEEKGRVYMSLTEAYFYDNNFREALKSVQEAKKSSDQRRNAVSWEQYIRQKASNRGVSL